MRSEQQFALLAAAATQLEPDVGASCQDLAVLTDRPNLAGDAWPVGRLSCRTPILMSTAATTASG